MQMVVSFTNRMEGQMAMFNRDRTRKPQTFIQKQGSNASLTDTTDNGEKCDFCKWKLMTAEDTFGRIERTHAVTASNLFKYGQPYHGLALFKHHDPLAFDFEQLQDLMAVSLHWFDQAHRASQEIEEGFHLHLHPFFLWNCLARSGASQYHGHAQLLLTSEPLPIHNRVAEAKRKYKTLYPNSQGYILDLFRALEEVGLALPCESTWIAASPCPVKDMETLILGKALDDPSFVRALLFSLRTLIDDLGVESFNVGIIMEEGRVMARVVSRGKTNQTASDFGALEVIGGASIGHSDPFVVIDAIRTKILAAP